jgi:hypothetical protein
MRALVEQAGGTEQLRRGPSDARAAAERHDRARATAQAADQRGVDHLRRQVSELTARAEQASTTAADLVAEQQLRATMPAEQKALELRLRTSLRTEQREQDRVGNDDARPNQRAGHPRRGRPHEPPHRSPSVDRGPA